MDAPVRFDIEGMHCGACVARVERALGKVDGVERVAVNLSTASATVYGPASRAQDYEEAIRKTGFDVRAKHLPRQSAVERTALETARWRKRALVGLACAIPVMVLHWTAGGASWAKWTSFSLAALATVVVGGAYFSGALRAARNGGTNMDTLVSLGTLSAFIFSTITLAGNGPFYFDATVMILALVSVGKWIESHSKYRASTIFESMNLAVQGDYEIVSGDQPKSVPVDKIERGDHVRLRAGQVAPIDGTVIDGMGEVDAAVVTGESLPESVQVGAEVVAGSKLINGVITVAATTVGKETTTARIQAAVEALQDQKAAIQVKLADRAASIFVPIVLVIASITLVAWLVAGSTFATAIGPTVAVLVVACPCALGLATPIAIMIASSRASERGILIRDVSVFEDATKISNVVFDKTGTLTTGALQVVEADPEVLRLAAAVERGTTHPIATAISAADESSAVADDVQTIVGEGVEGSVDGARIRVGRPNYVSNSVSDIVVSVCENGDEIGQIKLRADTRPDAKLTVKTLGSFGIDSTILSGDRRAVADQLAQELNIPESSVIADVRPDEKAQEIEALMKTGAVAMVGDGVNDAQALSAATIGIAMGSGSDFAKSSAAITIVGDRLLSVVEAISLAKLTRRVMLQNLGWAFAYNIILIPVAAFGYLSPVYAAGAMALSSVSVVANALRIRVPEVTHA